MITAANFEDRMHEIVRDYRDQPEAMQQQANELVINTLDCMGYAAGARIFENIIKKAPSD